MQAKFSDSLGKFLIIISCASQSICGGWGGASENYCQASPSQGKLVNGFSLNPVIMKEKFSASLALA